VPSAIHPVTAERIARHGFVHRPAITVAGAARLTTALQAQDALQSRLGVRARADGITESDVLAAIADRSVVRTWLMRGTVHLVDADDVRWMTALFGPTLQRRFRKRWTDLGLTADVLRRTARALPAVLSDGPRSRADIVAELRDRKLVPDSPDPQAVATHILLHATSIGLLCRATDHRRDALFTLLDDWTSGRPDGPRGDHALAEVVRRYFAAFSPATAADFTAWSGLPAGTAIALMRDELEPVDVAGSPGYRLRGSAPELAPRGSVRLVSGYDNYLVGYRDRGLLIADEHRPAVYVGGVIKPTVLLDGCVVATWRLARTTRDATVTVTPLREITGRTRNAIAREARDIGKFLGVPTQLHYDD
jgi:hypothetical protein